MAHQEAYQDVVGERLPRVRERIAAAARRGGRDPSEVRIVAVTKGHHPAAVRAGVAAGLRDLGENRVRELGDKLGFLGDAAVDDPGWRLPRDVRWHMIGHVQRRQAGGAARFAALIHSVDSLRLAGKLSRIGVAEGRRVPVLVQVNVSGEAAKGGFPEAEALEGIGGVAALPGLRAGGLMTMAPFTSSERTLRDTFRRTRLLLEAAAGIDGLAGRELSMGMSNDFEIAIEEGSTMVRLGTTLFGERPR